MKLYGSIASPYVRRIRVVLAQTPHEFIDLQIYGGADREVLASRNPAMKIPCLEHNGEMILDSRIIYAYLAEHLDLEPLTWEEENLLTLIDAVNDSFVNLLILTRSDVDVDEDRLFFRLQKERIDSVLDALELHLEQGGFSQWSYPEICLYTMVDWVIFRKLHNFNGFTNLLAFHEKHQERIELTATDPRQ